MAKDKRTYEDQDYRSQTNSDFTANMRENGGTSARDLAVVKRAKQLSAEGVTPEAIVKRMDNPHPDEYMVSMVQPVRARRRAHSVT